jgi:hypothetical protein
LGFLFHIDEERQSLLLAATSCLTHAGSNSKVGLCSAATLPSTCERFSLDYWGYFFFPQDTAGGGAPELRLLPRRACENGTVPQLILNHTDLILSDIDWALDSLAHRIRHHVGQEAASQDERAAEKLCATLCLVIDVFGAYVIEGTRPLLCFLRLWTKIGTPFHFYSPAFGLCSRNACSGQHVEGEVEM